MKLNKEIKSFSYYLPLPFEQKLRGDLRQHAASRKIYLLISPLSHPPTNQASYRKQGDKVAL
jgi:hypothetical protein